MIQKQVLTKLKKPFFDRRIFLWNWYQPEIWNLTCILASSNQGSLYRFSKLEVTFNVILFCFCHLCENPKDISFVRFDRFYKHTARIRLGNLCESSFLMFCLWNSIKTDQKNNYLFLLKLNERTKKIWIRECLLLFWVTGKFKMMSMDGKWRETWC